MFVDDKREGETRPIESLERQLLRNTLETLSQPGVWINRDPCGDPFHHCIITALNVEAHRICHPIDRAYDAITRAISWRAKRPYYPIPHWNDNPKRTLEEVQAVLLDAIASTT